MRRPTIIILVVVSVVTLGLVAARLLSGGDETSDATRFATRLVWKGDVSWSPDGKRIALVRGPRNACGGDIYVVNAQSGKPRRITSLSDSERKTGVFSPVWSPDGKKIAFSLTWPGYGGCWYHGIDVIDSDGSGRARLTREPRMPDGECHSWSPNGRWIVFAEPGAPFDWVVVMKADGTKQRRLARASLPAGCPVWSPDGRRIAFVRGTAQDVGSAVAGEVYVVGLDGHEKRLTRTRNNAWSPTWAPDGSQLAFITGDENPYGYSIRAVRLDGSGLRRIAVERTTLSLDLLTWSPDGRRMAYERSVFGSNDFELVVISSEGSDRRTLANGCCVIWSPDGTKLAVENINTRRIFIVKADRFGLPGSLRRILKN